MKILFTKKVDKEMVSEKLGNHFSCDFVEVIQINFKKIDAFDLENKNLIFTSLNGIKVFFENNFEIQNNKIFCIGKKAENFLEEKGFNVYKSEKNAEDLAEFILKNTENNSFIHFAGNLSLNILEEKLNSESIDYQKVVVYETEFIYPKISENYDAIVFFSPSGVRSFAKFNSLENLKLFSIGETTANELKNFTKNKIFTSKENTLEDLLKTINQQL